jgi:ABC-type multidrug transport system permease subunit
MEQLVNDFSEKGHLFDIMVNLDSTVISLNDLAKNFGLTFSQSREDFGATLQDLRQTMENLDELSGMLVENPSLLLYGTPQKKRKIK